MKDLEVLGVPQVLKNTCFSFEYNNIKKFEKFNFKKKLESLKWRFQDFEPQKIIF